MNQGAAARIEAIRTAVQQERKRIGNLESKLKDPNLMGLTKRTSSLLTDIELFFLDTKIINEPRSAAALSSWLGNAEGVLQFAIDQRKYLEDVLAKYGPDVRSFP